MSPRDRKHVLLLAIAVATWIAVAGCVTLPRWEWYPAADPIEWYRWEKVERGAGFELLCGAVPADRDKACVIRLNDGVIKPTDKSVSTGKDRGERSSGRLCLILSTLSEDDARAVPDQFYESTLRDHEVIEHCGKGLDHRLIPGRIG